MAHRPERLSLDLGITKCLPKLQRREKETTANSCRQGGSLLYSQTERVEGLTSKISLLALGDVFSLNTLMATGIFTFSPSGIQMPWV